MYFSKFIIILPLLLVSCRSITTPNLPEPLTLKMQQGAAFVIGTISKSNGAGLLGNYPSTGFLRFESVPVMQPNAGTQMSSPQFHVQFQLCGIEVNQHVTDCSPSRA